MAKQAGTDKTLLTMALVGYEAEKSKINAAIAEIRARLGGQASAADGQPAPRKRTMSAAARRRIGAAQRKRWAAVKKSQASGKSAAKPASKKRKMSAAARKKSEMLQGNEWAAQRRAAGEKAATASA